MLSAKPWKPDAIIRLVLSVIICFFVGSSIGLALQHGDPNHKLGMVFFSLIAAAVGFLGAGLVLLRRRWQIENVMRRLVVSLVCLYAGLVFCMWAAKLAGPVRPSVDLMIVTVLSVHGAGLALVVAFLREHEITSAQAFGWANHLGRSILLGITLACIFLPIGLSLQWLSAEGLRQLRLNPEAQQVVQTLQMERPGAGRAIFGLLSILVVPPVEEAFFRGILYPWIKQAGLPRLALWGTSFLFGAVHLNLVSFIPLSVLGLCLALAYEWTDNLLAPVTAHALFNGLNLARLCLLENQMS